MFDNLGDQIYKTLVVDDRWQLFVTGIGNTFIIAGIAVLLGVLIGSMVAIAKVNFTGRRGFRWLTAICDVYLTVIRGTPVVVQIMIMFFVVFASSRNKILVGCLCFGINSGAYVAEIFRSGIMSIDAGQTEAGRSLGFGYIPTMRYIILPQAFKNVLPTLGNEFIVLLKETAVVGYIGLSDLTYAANTVGGNTYEYLYPLLLAAAIYLIMVMFFSYLVGRLERRLRNSER